MIFLQNNKKLILTFNIFIALLLVDARNVYAMGCDENYISLEKAFVYSDIIFNGVVESEGPDSYIFDVKELYKAPDEISGDTELQISLPGIDAGVHFEMGLEYFVFGHLRETGGKYKVEPSSCLGTKPSPKEFIELLQEWKKESDLFEKKTAGMDELVFTGRVNAIQHTAFSKPEQIVAKSKITFDVLEIIKNTTSSPALNNHDQITIHTAYCGQEYRIGQEYLVFGSPTRITDPQSDKPHKREDVIYGNCIPWGVMNLNEKEVLRELGSKILKMGGSDGD